MVAPKKHDKRIAELERQVAILKQLWIDFTGGDYDKKMNIGSLIEKL